MWKTPTKSLYLEDPLGLRISKPDGLTVPSCEIPDGPYMNELAKAAAKNDKDATSKAALFLYAVMIKAVPFVTGGDIVDIKVLHPYAKLAYYLEFEKRDQDALKAINATIELAKQLKSQGESDPNFEAYVLLAVRALVKVCSRLDLAGTIDSLTTVQQELQSNAQKVTQVIGDQKITRLLVKNGKSASSRLQALQTLQKSAKARSPKQSPNQPLRNTEGSENSARSTSLSKSKEGSNHVPTERGRRKSTEELKGPSAFLTVPGQKNSSARPQSTGNQRNVTDDTDADKKLPARRRTASTADIARRFGQGFDSIPSDSLSVDPFEWALPVNNPGAPSLLQQTQKFLRDSRSSSYPKGNAKSTRRVRVAVFDTGVNKSLIKRGSKRIRRALCTIPGCESEGEQDDAGHGTSIILLLLDICPEADIYSYRVFKSTDRVDSLTGIVPAIEQAILDEVDIISLSFGFRAIPTNVADALRKATSKSILVFAAASNSGALPSMPIAWPASDVGHFAIFATTKVGLPWENNPPAPKNMTIKFGTLGRDLKPSQLPKEKKALSGTSYATPIAAGTAALILDFARLEPDTNHRAIKRVELVHLYRGMEAILQASSQELENGLHFIKPWHLFEMKEWNRNDIAAKIDDILQSVFG